MDRPHLEHDRATDGGATAEAPAKLEVPQDFRADIEAIARLPGAFTMLETVCLASGVRFAAIARVTESRWVTCSTADHLDFGLKPGDELVVESTLCHEVRQMASEIVIDDVRTDAAYRDHHTPRQYGFRSYLSIPIHRNDGRFFGTLCALDPEPRRLSDPRVLQMVRLFAKLIGDSLETGERLQEAQDELSQEREVVELQEKFMAMLAHDLRNPLSAMRAGVRILSRKSPSEDESEILGLMDNAAQRMNGLIGNLLDHARNRLGGGIVIERKSDAELGSVLGQIVAEFRTISAENEIVADIDLDLPVYCDGPRIAQVLSNLIGNAITHGAPQRPVLIRAAVISDAFVMTVTNEGPPIPAEQIPRLFEPFQQGEGRPGRQGLGLGLYIAAEIAKAHDGAIEVDSDAMRTVFRFHMPLNDPAAF